MTCELKEKKLEEMAKIWFDLNSNTCKEKSIENVSAWHEIDDYEDHTDSR